MPGRRQCLAAIYAALAANASVEAFKSKGCTALHLAARYNPDPEAVAAAIATLAAGGADVNARAQTNHNKTALHLAAINPNAAAAAAAVQALVAAGADISKTSHGAEPLHWVGYQSSAEAVPAVVQGLVAVGCDPNSKAQKGTAPLVSKATCLAATVPGCFCVMLGLPPETDSRVVCGVHVLSAREFLTTRHASGSPGLQHWAVKHTSAAVAAAAVEALVAAGADVHHRDNRGWSPLHWVAGQASTEAVPAVVQALVAAGADVGAKSTFGSNALHSVGVQKRVGGCSSHCGTGRSRCERAQQGQNWQRAAALGRPAQQRPQHHCSSGSSAHRGRGRPAGA